MQCVPRHPRHPTLSCPLPLQMLALKTNQDLQKSCEGHAVFSGKSSSHLTCCYLLRDPAPCQH
jgi:hypothetical protein